MKLQVIKPISIKHKQKNSVIYYNANDVIKVNKNTFLILCKTNLSNFIIQDEKKYEFIIYSKVLGKNIILGNDKKRAYKEKNYYTFDEMERIIKAVNNFDKEKQIEHLKILDAAKLFGPIDEIAPNPIVNNDNIFPA